MFPAARIGDTTATGDSIVGPGAPTVLIGNLPASVVGDNVVGPICNVKGTITLGSFTVLICNKPAARVTSLVVGVNQPPGPVPPVPIATTVIKGEFTVLIGG